MTRAPGLGLAVTAGALVLAAYAIDAGRMWSSAGNLTVPWFCTALAIALLLAAATSGLCGRPLREVPIPVRGLVAATAAVILAVGLVFDAIQYDERYDFAASVAEWIGFVVLLALVFLIPGAPAIRREPEAPPDS